MGYSMDGESDKTWQDVSRKGTGVSALVVQLLAWRLATWLKKLRFFLLDSLMYRRLQDWHIMQ